jgi:formylmethanofuran dehydrogenase subunit D
MEVVAKRKIYSWYKKGYGVILLNKRIMDSLGVNVGDEVIITIQPVKTDKKQVNEASL